jgi:uncharacterized surface protein with fasciclin (FAS1) repeats
MKNIPQTAIDAGMFTTLVAALTEAGWVEPLSGDGPFTVFAPTDEAFAKIPKETLDAVMQDKEKLASILKYHVVSGKIMAADVTTMAAPTLEGSDIQVKVTDEGVWVNDAKVIQTDIECTNGVIHVIDTVLMPQ